jgi:hypothetical protein
MLSSLITLVLIIIVARPVTAKPVDLALVLAADVSGSVDEGEFQLQRQGYAAAIRNQQVLSAILSGTNKAIALCFIEWAGAREQQVVVDWTIIRDSAIAADFATKLLAAPRSFSGSTVIGAAIDAAIRKHADSRIESRRRTIDVSGDGDNNQGRPDTEARDDAIAAGITVTVLQSSTRGIARRIPIRQAACSNITGNTSLGDPVPLCWRCTILRRSATRSARS